MFSQRKTPVLSLNNTEALERILNEFECDSDCTFSEELSASRSLATDIHGLEECRIFYAIANSSHPGRALFYRANKEVHLESETPGVSWCSLKFWPDEVHESTFPSGVSLLALSRMSTYRGARVCDECLGHAYRYAEAVLTASAKSLLKDLDVAALQGHVNP